jgi:excisionase family DNA binding protein
LEVQTLTPEEIADYLQVQPQTVWRMIRRGDLPAIRVGRVYRVQREDFDDWLKQRRTKASGRGEDAGTSDA